MTDHEKLARSEYEFVIAQIDEGIISAPPTQITNGRNKASGIELVDEMVDPLEAKLI